MSGCITFASTRKSPEGNNADARISNYFFSIILMSNNQPARPAIEEKSHLLTGRPYEAKRMSKGCSSDYACTLQRHGLETGTCFTVDDKPGMSPN